MSTVKQEVVQEQTITYMELCAQYQPICNPNSKDPDCMRFETFGDDLEAVLKMAKADPDKIWTELDCDGETVIGSGYHYVNRLCYYITAVAVSPSISIVVIDD